MVARGLFLQPQDEVLVARLVFEMVVRYRQAWRKLCGVRLGMVLAGVSRVSPSPAVVSLADALPGPQNHRTAAKPMVPFGPAGYHFEEIGSLDEVRCRPVEAASFVTFNPRVSCARSGQLKMRSPIRVAWC